MQDSPTPGTHIPAKHRKSRRRSSRSSSTGDRKMVAFYTDVRTDHGLSLHAAIVHQQIEFWMEHATKEHDGHEWIYKSYPELAEDTTLTYDQVRKAIQELLANNMIEQIHNPLRGNDRTYWYRLVDGHVCGETQVSSGTAQMTWDGAQMSSDTTQMDVAHNTDGPVVEPRSTVTRPRTIPVETPVETAIETSLTKTVDDAVEGSGKDFREEEGLGEAWKRIFEGEDESEPVVKRSQIRSRSSNDPYSKRDRCSQLEQQPSLVIEEPEELTPADGKLAQLRRKSAEGAKLKAAQVNSPEPVLEMPKTKVPMTV